MSGPDCEGCGLHCAYCDCEQELENRTVTEPVLPCETDDKARRRAIDAADALMAVFGYHRIQPKD